MRANTIRGVSAIRRSSRGRTRDDFAPDPARNRREFRWLLPSVDLLGALAVGDGHGYGQGHPGQRAVGRDLLALGRLAVAQGVEDAIDPLGRQVLEVAVVDLEARRAAARG